MCPSAMLGISCPGCGGLRAVNDLTNFQLVDAASSNLLFVLALPVILFALVRWVTDQWRGTTRVANVNWLATTGVVACSWSSRCCATCLSSLASALSPTSLRASRAHGTHLAALASLDVRPACQRSAALRCTHPEHANHITTSNSGLAP